jgi:beta-lactamase class A
MGLWMHALALLATALFGLAEGEELGQAPVICQQPRMVDTDRLGEVLKARGVEVGGDFKALIVRIEEQPGCGLVYRAYDHNGTSAERESWWPASTVKLLAAVAALERLHQWEFTPAASVTFHYAEAEGGEVTQTVSDIVRAAISPSDNTAFDRLVELAGYEWLNDVFLSDANGLGASVLQRGYGGRHRYADSGRGSLRNAPRITLSEGQKHRVLPATQSRKSYPCPDQGNCVPLRDLSDCLKRVMLHEQLPTAERFNLSREQLVLLRLALSAKRDRGLGVVNGLTEAFGPDRLVVHHKAGFALQWFSDNVFALDRKTGRRWLVALANRPGREALDELSVHVGIILRDGLLDQKEP